MTQKILLVLFAASTANASLPNGFSYLRDIDPTIQQDIRYASDKNFTASFVPGYLAKECVIKTPAAKALKKVQDELRAKGFSLKVYDCYRPQKAVSFFVNWVKDPHAPSPAKQFYPREKKNLLIQNGYIAARSGHSKGNTLDLTLVPISSSQPPIQSLPKYGSCIESVKNRIPDNSVEMGTGYDCFDSYSHTKSSHVSALAKQNRMLLLQRMTANGFKNYTKEWWHFTYKNTPSGSTYYNFDIVPKNSN